MKITKNTIRILAIAILGMLAFGTPSQTKAMPNHVELDQFSCTNVSEIPQIECEALVELYNSGNGPNWNDNRDWLLTNTPCNWSRIVCGDEYITELLLHSNRVTNLPPEIGNLHNLGSLVLNRNDLSSLPAEIGNLNNLTKLYLDNNELNALPAEIGNLNNLDSLSLNINNLSSLPAEIGNLNNLTLLRIGHNELLSLPAEIINLSNLTSLAVYSNHLVNVSLELRTFLDEKSPGWSQSQSATTGQFSCINVSEIPQIECEALIVIYNSNNGAEWNSSRWLLTNTPCRWLSITCSEGSVTALDLDYYNNNGSTNTLLATIANLSNLRKLTLANNELGSLPPEIGNLSNLVELNLWSAQLSTLPPEIGNLSNLTLLDLWNNELSGLPSEFWNLSNLIELDLSDNQLSSLPSGIGNLSNLTRLRLSRNQLSNLPSEIGHLSNLEYLSLSFNQFSSLPSELWTFSNLTSLSLRENQLSSLPSEIGNLKNLIWLDLFDNQLSSLPPEIGRLSNLDDLELQGNQLNSLPPEIGNLSNLTELQLSKNQLSRLPSEIGNLSTLAELRLWGNQLSSLPPEIGNLSNLEYLDLNSNLLSNLPSEIGNLSSLRYLTLDLNQLGSLPSEIVNLSRISRIYLAYNRLVIPDTNLRDFIERENYIWATTQTVAPIDIAATSLSDSSAQLTWTPIAFQDKGGYYEISLATEGGTFNVHGTTASKSDNSYTIGGLTLGEIYAVRIRTYTPPHTGGVDTPFRDAWGDQRNELWSDYSELTWFKMLEPTLTPMPTPTSTPTNTPTPTPTFTPTVTNTPTPTPVLDDDYEPDSNCNDAAAIQPNGVWQAHNFHAPGDIDWATFTAPTAGTYRIEVTIPDSARADVELFYYTECGNASVDKFVESFTPGARLDVQADSSGQQFYIELRNVDSRKFGLDVNYNLSLRQISSVSNEDGNSQKLGPAIVVAGRYREDDSAQDNINQVAINAYNLFKAKGKTDSDIYFLATDPSLAGYDDMATQSNLELAITDWAKEELQKEDTSKVLTLYLVDHGHQDQLYLDKINQEIHVPNDLDTWLTTLEDEIVGLQVNVIIEASRAGSFIDSANGTISKTGRVIITSSSKDQDANLSPHGALFSDNFITYLSQEYNLDYSFNESTKMVQVSRSSQDPWIDADGNSEPNEPNDILLASARSFVGPNSVDGGWPPYIATTQLTERISGLQVEVRHREGISDIEAVWAVVYPPDYTQPTGTAVSDGELNEEALDIIELEIGDEDIFVEIETYLGFTETGVYQVAIYARDANGLVAQPVMMMVDTHHWLFLPVVSR